MEAIQRIVREIVFMCRVRNVPVSDTLAAFMARAVVLENATQFPLDKELNENDVQDLVKMATERLLMKDSPSLEMVKMQVGFDTAGAQEVDTLGRTKDKLDASEGTLIREISEARLKPGNDVEALTALYRRIFNFLVVRAGHEAGHEREIAAALESVFPRIGLKAFTSLAAEDKVAQLHELANIVLGIRLFNRHIGKGGAGIQDVPRVAAELVASLVGQVGEDLEGVETLCAQYVDVVAHKYRSGAKSSGEAGARLARLQQAAPAPHTHTQPLPRERAQSLSAQCLPLMISPCPYDRSPHPLTDHPSLHVPRRSSPTGGSTWPTSTPSTPPSRTRARTSSSSPACCCRLA